MQLTKATKTILGIIGGAAVVVGGVAGFEALRKPNTGTILPPPPGGGPGGAPPPAALSVVAVKLGVV